jgi:hypothetical protein
MAKSILYPNDQRDYEINGIDSENNIITNLTSKKIKPIFEEKFLIEHNSVFNCRLKKDFKYLNNLFSIFIYFAKIDFSIAISRTGKLRNILIDKNKKRIEESKNGNSNLYENSTISVIQNELFKKIFKSIDIEFLQEMFYNIFELYLKNSIQFIDCEFFKIQNEIMYKIGLQGTVEFVILTDDKEIFIDILSGKDRSEYFYKIKEAIKLKKYKNTIKLL